MRAYLDILRRPGTLAFCLAGLLARFGGAMMGIGTLLMVSSLYGSYGQAGGLTAANVVAWAAGTAYLSNLVDRVGQRRVMLPAAMVSAAALAGLVLCALAHTPIGWLYLLTVVSGGTAGSVGAMVRARWNHALSSSQDLHTAYALESTLDEVTFVVGPVLATWLATSIHPVAGLVAPIILGASGAVVFYSLRASEPPIIATEPTASRGRFILAYPGLVPVAGVVLLMGALFGSIDVSVVAATSDWGARSMAGLVLGVMSLGSAIGGLLYGSRGWASALWKRFAIGACLLGVTVCTFFFATTPLVLGICGFIAGFCVAPTFINANALVGRLVPPNRLTEGLAWIGTAVGVGVSIGSTLAGHLIDLAGYHAGFGSVVGCGVLGCALGLMGAPILKRILALEPPAH